MPLRTNAKVLQRESGQTVIAHISDLHFTGNTKTDDGIWRALHADFEQNEGKIDLVAVTGDVIDGSLRDAYAVDATFERARTYLLRLCEAAKVSPDCLFVVPGNHDARISGVFRRRAQADAFIKCFGAYFGHAYFPQLRASIFSFDSNTSLSRMELAAGSVRREELTDLTSVVEEIENITGWENSTRIALLHHHPMPIAQHRDFNNLEEYLLLRNAGMFMVEMLRRNVDVILHGHKHYPAASKAVYFDGDNVATATPRSVAVVAGGSAGEDGDRAMYNLVTVSDSGEITVQRRSHYAAAFTSRTMPTRLITYDEARSVKFDRLARASNFGLRLDAVTRMDNIAHAGGDLLSQLTFMRARSYTGKPVSEYPIKLTSSTGYFEDPEFDSNRVKWEEDEMEDVEGVLRGFATFDPPLLNDPLTFTLGLRSANAMYFSKRDRSDATGQPKYIEDVAMSARFIADRLTMTIRFPRYCYPSTAPRLVVEHGSDTSPERDYAEEAHCAPYLICIDSSRTFVFSVDRPLPGYRYRIEWPLPENDPTEPPAKPGVIGTLREIRRQLGQGDRHADIIAALEDLRADFRAAVVLQEFGAATETVDFSLFLYDESLRGLHCAHTTIAATDDPILTKVIPPGREIVGQAYRRRKPVLYLAESDTDASAYTDTTRSAVFAAPVFYPILEGRRAGIVSLASSSNVTWMAHLHENPVLVTSITEQISSWWELLLKRKLELPKVLRR